MFSSIRWRLVGSYLLLTLITTFILGLIFLSILSRYFLQQEESLLLENGHVLSGRVARALSDQDTSQLGPLVSAYGLFSQSRIRVLDSQGLLLIDSWEVARDGSVGFSFNAPRDGSDMRIGFESLPSPSRESQSSLLREAQSPWGGYVFVDESARLVTGAANTTSEISVPVIEVQVPVQRDKETLGYIQLSRPATRGQMLLALIRQALLWACLAALSLAAGMGLLISHSLTAPLAALSSITRKMAQGDLEVRAPVSRRDEIGRLAEQFNHMAGSLQQSFTALAADRDALRRFAADASHELRTPIAALKTFNELLLDQVQEDMQARQEFLQESQQQIERLDWLTHNLLQLSRLDSGVLQMDFAAHNLVELVNGVVNSFLPQAKEKGISLTVFTPDGEISALSDRRWIEQAVGNLVSNALKFTPAGGEVKVGVSAHYDAPHPDTAEVWVEDNGVGITADDLPHIFERFYRAKTTQEKGNGLGLAIAKAIILAHHGQIEASSQPGKGSRFWFRIPVK